MEEAYKNYLKKRTMENKDNVREPHTLANGMTGQISRAFTQEEFINKIKTDDKFAKKWGVNVEVRELSLLERYELMKKLDSWVSVHYTEPKTMEYMDSHNIPTKLISFTYNNETMEIYEYLR